MKISVKISEQVSVDTLPELCMFLSSHVELVDQSNIVSDHMTIAVVVATCSTPVTSICNG